MGTSHKLAVLLPSRHTNVVGSFQVKNTKPLPCFPFYFTCTG